MKNAVETKKSILIVEDDMFIRGNIIEILDEEGFRARGAANGKEALEYLRVADHLPSVILLDLMMPVMNGWQFRIEQEQDARLRRIPVIVVTADGNAREKAHEINAEGWVRKPIEIGELLKVIQSCGV